MAKINKDNYVDSQLTTIREKEKDIKRIMNNLKEVINERINTMNIGKTTLSNQCGIPYSTLNRFFNGEASDINMSNAYALSKGLNLSLDKMFNTDKEIDVNENDINVAKCFYELGVLTKQLGLHISFDDSHAILTSNNQFVVLFLKSIALINSYNDIKTLADIYNNLTIYKGTIGNKETLYEKKCDDYVYSGIADEIREESFEEYCKAVQNRTFAFKLYYWLNITDEKLLKCIQIQVLKEREKLEREYGDIEHLFNILETKSDDIVKNAKEVYNKEGNKKWT